MDDFTKGCPTFTGAFMGILDSIALLRGYPATIRTELGPKFTCRALEQWAFEHGVEPSGKSTQTDLLRL